jgi:hypothetical protein
VIDSLPGEAYHFCMIKRVCLLSGVLALTAGLCFGQDVVGAAKKEKERRDALKSGKAAVITNATLSELKKKPSGGSIRPEGGQDLGPAGNPAAMNPAPGATAAAPLAGPEPESPGAPTREQMKADYQDRFDRAKERMDLLGLKLLSLRQQLTTFNSMESKEKVQRDFAETYQKFQQAQVDSGKAKEDLDRVLGSSAQRK